MPALKRLRKSQQPVASGAESSKRSFILTRLLEEVGGPIDESVSLCQRLIDGFGGGLSFEQRKWVEEMACETTQTAQRLKDYVDFMLLEGSDFALRTEVYALDESIEQAVRLWKPAALAKGLDLVVEPAVSPLPPVQADRSRVVQVLSNLIANAVKFTDHGQIILSTEPYDRSVAVHVVDTGVGIPATQVPMLFEDFYQGEGAKEGDPFAGGLGLTLSRRLVVRLGGDLWASSTLGTGSKFSFTVPRAPSASVQSSLSPV